MEQALYAEDPRFASTIRDTKTIKSSTSGLFAVVTAIGIAGIIAGLTLPQPIVGIAGFAITLFGLYRVVMAVSASVKGVSSAAKSPKSKKPGFLKGAADRFDQRRNESGQ
jgi:hypothetical protein